MNKLYKKKVGFYFFTSMLIFLTACSQYTGLRTPLYDGEPIEPKEEAIELYRKTAEVTGAEKELYIRYPFSADILQKSLAYPNEAPLLLEGGRYVIGDDLPAGRATLLGNESSFSSENYDVHVGNLVIRDAAGEVYFENLFHSEYGQLLAQVDLISGHELTIIGNAPEITVFYEETLPVDPYVLMDLPMIIENIGATNMQSPVKTIDDGKVVQLVAGIYEVGLHLEPGEYLLSDFEAPHNSEMYIFGESLTPRVIELLLNQTAQEDPAKIKLEAGEKIYLNLARKLELINLSK